MYLTADLKQSIICQLQKVSPETVGGMGLNLFLQQAANKTDADYLLLLQQIKAQLNDCPEVAQNILGDSYAFFQILNIK